MYQWLFDIFRRSPNPPVLTYTPAHTSDQSTPAHANRLVDHLASSLHAPDRPLLSLPLPTFTLPLYVLYAPSHGYVLPPIPSTLDDLLTSSRLSDASARPNPVLFRCLYDDHPPPPHPYTRASSAYSALVQLYSRSSQLDDAFTRYRRFGDASPACHFGCATLEIPHHLFVECPHFSIVRDGALGAVTLETSSLLTTAETPLLSDVILRTAHTLFVDDPDTWPQYFSHYYCGTVPPLPAAPNTDGTRSSARRLLSCIATLWHSTSIRLAARIWGSYKRALAPCLPRSSPTISLPRHLDHLL